MPNTRNKTGTLQHYFGTIYETKDQWERLNILPLLSAMDQITLLGLIPSLDKDRQPWVATWPPTNPVILVEPLFGIAMPGGTGAIPLEKGETSDECESRREVQIWRPDDKRLLKAMLQQKVGQVRMTTNGQAAEGSQLSGCGECSEESP